ncbi:MAG: hypothetical protein JRJ12_02645 [Deltaproteobacteria bacterium]|nr:hypothetical protein [Deltaproteobacteria bacterium]
MPQHFKDGFLQTLWILRDYLPVIVVGGGWVPLLYYHYLLADKSKEPIRTRDIDLFVDIHLPVVGEKPLDELLLEAGFKPTFKSADSPPIIHYVGTIAGEEVEIEFLTDQRGARDAVVIEVQKGLHAEALRYISIPVTHAIEVTVDDFRIGKKYQALKVRVPSPEAYIFHKGLIFERRKDRQKKAKDLYYIFDILANCPELKEPIITGLKGFQKEYHSWFSRFIKNLQKNFLDLGSDGIFMISSQRPAGAFPGLTREQFRQYVFAIFLQLIEELTIIPH